MAILRKAGLVDTAALASTLSRAFYDDPVTSWMFPRASKRQGRLERVFTAMLTHVGLPRGHCYVATNGTTAGGAIWVPPGAWPYSRWEELRLAPSSLPGIGRRVPAAIRLNFRLEAAHPRDPHWYLAVLGTEPSQQGRGIGTALISHVLQRCDSKGIPAYLESSNEANIAFYARHGFEVTGELRAGSSPTLWAMWREPR